MSQRVLFAWEIGEGSGHVGPYLGLLDALQAQGWEVALALKNTSVLDGESRARFPTVFQAPLCVNEFTGIAPDPASFTEICLGFGYAHADTLAGLVRGWRALFAAWQPDLLLANFAPASLLAARIDGIPRIRMGTGYENSPPGARLPLLAGWTPEIDSRLERAEDLALRTANAVLGESGRGPAGSLSEIVAEVPTMLASLPELDFFRARDPGSATYLGPRPALRAGGVFPDGEADVFAYLQMEAPGTRAALDALARGRYRSWVYLPDASEATCARLGSANLVARRTPFDLRSTLARVRVVLGYGGHGTVLAALLAGKPSVLMPGTGEQAHNARCVVEQGCGIALGARAKASQVATAVDRCLDEAALADRARRFAFEHQEWTSDRALRCAIDACNQALASPGGLRVVRG